MMKRNGAADKIGLPMQQTVFLPKDARGVRYIDKVRTAVFAERLAEGDTGLWLRGFWELDLEYQGMEGTGLCKHRVGLPLKVQLPPRWPREGAVDVGDLHLAIKRPMIKLLSPYVLEFSADLQVEYLNEDSHDDWHEDCSGNATPPALPAWERECAHRLPVWQFDPVEKAIAKEPIKEPTKDLAKDPAKDPAKEQIYAPGLNKNRFRAILTAAAISRLQARGEDLTAAADVSAVAADVYKVDEKAREATEILGENLEAKVSAEDVAEEKLVAEDVTEEAVEEVSEEVGEEVENVIGETVEEVVEAASEDVVEEVVEVAESAQVAESAETATEEVVAEEENAVVVAAVAETAAEVAPREADGVQMVNNRGVKVRLAAKQMNPPRAEQRPMGGYSIKYYVVKPGDDAMHIALRHNISLERLREANHLPDGEPAAGTLLRIPG